MQLSRRDLLTALLGAPLAYQACARPAPELSWEGGFVGSDPEVGHILRSLKGSLPEAQEKSETEVLIVGGGVAGLSAAWRLQREGMELFEVLELEDAPGGTARSGQNRVSPFPLGAHYLPVPLPHHESLLLLLEELGLTEGRHPDRSPVIPEQYLVRQPEERYFWHGRWFEGLYPQVGSTPEELAQLQHFQAEVARLVQLRDGRGRRAFTIPVSRCSDDPTLTALDRISMAEWMAQQKLTSWRLRWLVDYACRDDYGTRLEHTSAWAGLFYFCARVSEAGHESAELMTWPEGNGRLVTGLQQKLAQKVHPQRVVLGILPQTDGRVEVRVLERERQRIRSVYARKVIYSAPLFLVPHLIPALKEENPSWASPFEHSPWLVANLTLRGRPAEAGFPLCWDNVLIESRSLGYVNATHQSLRDHGPTVLTWYLPLVGESVVAERKHLLSLDWRGAGELALADLQQAHPDLPALVERIDVTRWGHAMVRPVPGLLWGGARQRAAQPWRGIHFAHSDLSGMALFEEAHDQGVRAAEEVLVALQLPMTSLRG